MSSDCLRIGVLLVLVVTAAVPAVALLDVEGITSAADSAEKNGLSPGGNINVKPESVEATACPASRSVQNENKAAYDPLSARCKFSLFLRQTYSPYTFASAGFQASWAQATGQWSQYGGGMAGWGKRFGATLADTESRKFIQGFVLSMGLHQDPRYFPSHRSGFLPRMWYAGTRVAVGRSDDGHITFNSPEFLGALFVSSLENAYYPADDRSFGQTMGRFGGALASDVIGNLLREFTPDMKRLFRKHAPAKIKSLERKLPIRSQDKP